MEYFRVPRISSNQHIAPVRSHSGVLIARSLFRQYAALVDIDLSFQGFEAELSNLPGHYAPPTGELLLAYIGTEPAGCVALRAQDDALIHAEMKRLYVCEDCRGHGIGALLVSSVIQVARERNYKYLRLDSLAGKMDVAISLYRRFGFRPISMYTFNPMENATYWELELSR